MFRRLALTAAVLSLAGCGRDLYFPTDVSRQQNVDDDRTTMPPINCEGEPYHTLIPWCADGPVWPGEQFDLVLRTRHGSEGVTASAGGARGGRGGSRLF